MGPLEDGALWEEVGDKRRISGVYSLTSLPVPSLLPQRLTILTSTSHPCHHAYPIWCVVSWYLLSLWVKISPSLTLIFARYFLTKRKQAQLLCLLRWDRKGDVPPPISLLIRSQDEVNNRRWWLCLSLCDTQGKPWWAWLWVRCVLAEGC